MAKPEISPSKVAVRCEASRLFFTSTPAVGDAYRDHSPHASSLGNADQGAYSFARHTETM
jgi:hypothetical protein